MRHASEHLSERVIVPMAKAVLDSIQDFRFESRLGSRADAIRTLIGLGLQAHRRGQPEAKSDPADR